MKKNWIILSCVLILFVLAFFIGYFWGKSKSEVVEKEVEVVKYIPSDPIHDTIDNPVPYSVIVHDTVDNPIPTDTTELYEAWLNYNAEKSYNLDFSNDTIGEYSVDLSIQCNELKNVSSCIVPIQKVITNTKIVREIPTYQFYGMLGSDFNLKTSKIELGLDYKQKYMFSIAGIRHQQDYFYTINVGLKF